MFNTIYKNKKILITGHTGFKGSWLALWLSTLGADVAGFSAYIPSTPSNFATLGLDKKITDIKGDIRDFDQVMKAFRDFQPDAVFHLAAQPIVTISYEDPKQTFDTNVGGTVNILEAVRKTDSVKAALLITSDKCYENVEWEYGYRENDRLGGKDPYSASKAAAETIISAYTRSFFRGENTRIASARAGNVIGGGDWAKDRIVPDCVRAWASGQVPDVRNPHATRPWQHVLEPLSGYLHLMSNLLASGGQALHGEAFNFGPSEKVSESVAQLISAMGKIWENKAWNDCSDLTTLKKEAGLLKLNCDKARHHLGWNATLSLDETIRMTIEWYIQYYQDTTDMLAYTLSQIEEYQRLAQKRGNLWIETPQSVQPLKV